MMEVQRELRLTREKTSPQYEQARSDYAEADTSFRTPRQRMTIHMLLGAAATLLAILVNCITITYFIGTSRWCKEVADAYKLDARFVRESTLLKRRTFPLAVMSMLAMVGVAALGGAADPAAAMRLEPIAGITWAQIHLFGALAGLAFITWCFYRQWLNLLANQDIINQIQAEVRRIRLEKGLEV